MTRNALLTEQLDVRSDELQCALTRVKQLEDELELTSAVATAGVTIATVGTGSKMSSANDEAAPSDKADSSISVNNSISTVPTTAISKKGVKVNETTDVPVRMKVPEKSRVGARIPTSQPPSSSRGRMTSAGKVDKNAVNGTSITTSKQTEDEAKQMQVIEQLKTVTNELLQLKALQVTWHSEKDTMIATLNAKEIDVNQLSVALDDVRIDVVRLTASLAAAEGEAHAQKMKSQHLESERTAMEQEKNELLANLRQAIKASSGEFALFKDATDKKVASLEAQRDLDAATIAQLTQSSSESQTDIENLRLEHAEIAKLVAEQNEMVTKERCLVESLTIQLAEVNNNKALADTQLAQLQLEYAEIVKRIAEQDEMMKEGRCEIKSLIVQLAEVTNNKTLVDAQLAQLLVEHTEITKRVVEQDEMITQGRCEVETLTMQLAEVNNNKALADSQLAEVTDNKALADAKLAQLQIENAVIVKRVAEQDEILTKGKCEIESLAVQLAEAINNKALVDTQLAQLQIEHAEISKRVTEKDEMVRQGHSKELAQETRVAKLESQLLVLEKEHETHMLGCVEATSSLQHDKAVADERIAEQDEMVKKGLFVIESLTIQLAEVTNNKTLADARIVQLENQWKTDSDALIKQVGLVSFAMSFNVLLFSNTSQ